MDVRLPDGTIVQNVPEGMTQSQLFDKLEANGYDVSGFRPKPAPSWSEVPGNFVQAIPSDAGKQIGDLWTGVKEIAAHPLDVANNAVDTAYGGIRLGVGAISPKAGQFMDSLDNPEAAARSKMLAGNFGQYLKDRWGSSEAIRRTLSTEPLGALGDASMLFTGGGTAVAKAPGLLGKLGKTAVVAGEMIDPVYQAGNLGAKAVSKVAGAAVPGILGLTTGTSGDSIATAYRAGREGNQAFRAGINGELTGKDVAGMARDSVEAMSEERSRNYNANMASTLANGTVLDFMPLQNALTTARDRYAIAHGVVKNQEAADILGQMETKIGEWQNIQPVSVTLPNGTMGLSFPHRTPAGFDQLKQALGEIRNKTTEGSRARAAADTVYKSVFDEISRVAPNYARTMEEYGAASEDLNNIIKTFSLGEKVSDDTAVRKLQSTMRNNVNTNYGERTRLMEDLSAYQPDLPYAIAGQQLSSIEPRGLARFGASLGALQFLANPRMWASLGITSPRLVGEGAYMLGGAANTVGDALSRVPRSSYQLTTQYGRAANQVPGLLNEEEHQ